MPSLTLVAPSAQSFLNQATCPNRNWTKAIQEPPGIVLATFTYELTFVGFNQPYIRITP